MSLFSHWPCSVVSTKVTNNMWQFKQGIESTIINVGQNKCLMGRTWPAEWVTDKRGTGKKGNQTDTKSYWDTIPLAEKGLNTEATDLEEVPHEEGVGQVEGWSNPQVVCGVGECWWGVTLALAWISSHCQHQKSIKSHILFKAKPLNVHPLTPVSGYKF